MSISKFSLIAVFFLLLSCDSSDNNSKTAILLASTNPADLIEAYNGMTKTGDTIYLKKMLEKPYDARISNNLRYKGISVYQAKMHALERISGRKAPHTISYKIDTTNVNFYLNWALSKGYINKD